MLCRLICQHEDWQLRRVGPGTLALGYPVRCCLDPLAQILHPDIGKVGSGGGAVAVGSGALPANFRDDTHSGSRRSVSTPCPQNRTCGVPASGSPVGSCPSHAERRIGTASGHRRSPQVPWLCLPRRLGAARPHPRCPSLTRHRACSRPGSTDLLGPAPSLTHVTLRSSPLSASFAGLIGIATPAGLRSSVAPPHLRSLPSTGVNRRPQ